MELNQAIVIALTSVIVNLLGMIVTLISYPGA